MNCDDICVLLVVCVDGEFGVVDSLCMEVYLVICVVCIDIVVCYDGVVYVLCQGLCVLVLYMKVFVGWSQCVLQFV